MTMTPEVSVIIPTYNRRAMVREAVTSVLSQRDANFELIVVDDGSTDGTSDMLAELEGISLVRIEHRGVASARNHGVALANAPLIAFLDSDDLWAPDKLRRQLAFMREHRECMISQTQEIWIRDGRRVNPGLRHRKRAGDIFLDSLRTCLISPSAVMMRSELFRSLGGFDEDLLAAEDYDLWLRILVEHKVGLLEEPLMTRRAGHADQLSASTPAIDRYRVRALMKLLANDRVSETKRIATIEVLIEKCGILATGARRRGRMNEANLYNEVVSAASGWKIAPDEILIEMTSMIRGLLVGAFREAPATMPQSPRPGRLRIREHLHRPVIAAGRSRTTPTREGAR
ncbi:MAG TPA: glycosyltransferase family A protein [Candidatus Binataceae bacterium]|nr:glycosyltransferase family A protein [Candidatus Binataceae bacterium]